MKKNVVHIDYKIEVETKLQLYINIYTCFSSMSALPIPPFPHCSALLWCPPPLQKKHCDTKLIEFGYKFSEYSTHLLPKLSSNQTSYSSWLKNKTEKNYTINPDDLKKNKYISM